MLRSLCSRPHDFHVWKNKFIVILLRTRSEGLLDFHRAFVWQRPYGLARITRWPPWSTRWRTAGPRRCSRTPLGACGCNIMAAVLAAAAAMMAAAAMAAKAPHENWLSCSAVKSTKLAYLANASNSDMQGTCARLFPASSHRLPRISEHLSNGTKLTSTQLRLQLWCQNQPGTDTIAKANLSLSEEQCEASSIARHIAPGTSFY